ncbi:hypothetical protein MJ588_14845 [Klebsiella pneumoniae]|nr:hypothetical protein MJ588_14845 [Klebsiella pneumoniae]
MSDTVRQQAEREAAASRVMARADRLAALSEKTADALTRGLSVAGTFRRPTSWWGSGRRLPGMMVLAGQSRQHLRTL